MTHNNAQSQNHVTWRCICSKPFVEPQTEATHSKRIKGVVHDVVRDRHRDHPKQEVLFLYSAKIQRGSCVRVSVAFCCGSKVHGLSRYLGRSEVGETSPCSYLGDRFFAE
uniref:Uncharacterized protein n=1 Tax=Pseudomonas fluorescens (strain SBW25) TaxID=216595 RepID=A4V6Q6_PSEFS|nr:hypothetical protein pQBR0185 [Pseudomonas fluorescens SBW25]